MPKLFITLFLSCVILNIKGCSPLASVLLLKQTTAIVTLIILRFTQRFTQLPLRGYVWEHISKRCRKAKRTDNRLIINPFLPVGVTGFEPATTRPPDAYSNRAELHPELRMQRYGFFWYLQIFSVLFYIKSASFYARY